jgi:hypothetical protein
MFLARVGAVTSLTLLSRIHDRQLARQTAGTQRRPRL